MDQLEILLLTCVIALFGLVVLTAWRETSGRGFHLKKLSFRQLGYAAGISIAAPILAACLQSEWVVARGIRFYTAMASELSNPVLWIVFGVEALVTFVFLWLFMRVALWFRWPVLLLCLTFWTYVGFLTIAVTRANSFPASAFAKTAITESGFLTS